MKQKDIFLIAVVVIVSAVISIVISGKLISSPKNRSQKVEKVFVISSEFPTPDEKYFNKDSIDPTQIIKIGDSSNTKPFNSKQ